MAARFPAIIVSALCLVGNGFTAEVPSATESQTTGEPPITIMGSGPAESAQQVFLQRVRRLATIACASMEGDEGTAISTFLAEAPTESPNKSSVSPLSSGFAAEDSTPCMFKDYDCSEEQTAVLVRVDFPGQTNYTAPVAPAVAYDVAADLPLGYRDSISLSFDFVSSEDLETGNTVRVTALADKYWVIEEEALFGGLSPLAASNQSWENTRRKLHDLVNELFGSKSTNDNNTSAGRDITDLVRLLDSSYRGE